MWNYDTEADELEITILNNDNVRVPVHHGKVHEAQRTLGIILAPDGN